MEDLQRPLVNERRLFSWRDVVDVVDYFIGRGWIFRGHESADWTLQTSLEREFTARADVERDTLWRFVRLAPRLLSSHLVPAADTDAAQWLGLIQHYGGPTRLLDVTRSPYVALYFAFEAPGDKDRALWALDRSWCTASVARIMADQEGMSPVDAMGRAAGAQAQLVYSLVYGQPYPDRLFDSFKPFKGVFPLDPWKPDSRQIAQQAMFLCPADVASSFMDNLDAHPLTTSKVVYKFVLPAFLRAEAIEQLATMNVSAATLFPDLGGLARSLRTLTIRRALDADGTAWEPRL